jgi:hypothetical protein
VKTMLFIQFKPLLLEGAQHHHEAVGEDGDAHQDDIHVDEDPAL